MLSIDKKDAMLEEFAHFNPALVETIKSVNPKARGRSRRINVGNRLADDVRCWPLFANEPLSTWTYGKIVLTGDAAHPVSRSFRHPRIASCMDVAHSWVLK